MAVPLCGGMKADYERKDVEMSFSDCKSASALLNFFDNDKRALGHKNYYHYTSFSVAENIVKGKAFWMSQLCNTSNDAYEKKWYQDNGKYLFSLCFSTGSVESIPLWYLYARKEGTGARLIIPKTLMNRLWKYATFTLAETESFSNRKRIVPGTEIQLKDDDFRKQFRDILYVSRVDKEKGAYEGKDKTGVLRYNNEIIRIGANEIKGISESYMHFVKNQIWYYEKESRLEVELLNHELISEGKSYVICVDISSIVDEIKVMIDPKVNSIEGYCDTISDKRVILSEYKGQFTI